MVLAVSGEAHAEPVYDPVAVPADPPAAVEVVVQDAERDRELVFTVRVPPRASAEGESAPETLPLVIFSHGAGGSGAAFESLSEALAARGYVVIHPWHSDSEALRRRQGGETYDRRRPADQLVERVDLADRIADVRFIIDHLPLFERELELPTPIDPERIGMAGHSAGAMTTQVAAGLRFFPPQRGLGNRRGRGETRGISTPIPEIRAFAIISGQGTTRPSLNEQSWADMDRPTLTITGSRDESRVSSETPASRRHPFEFAPPTGNKYLLWMEGATHSSFQGSRQANALREQPPDNVDWIERLTTASVVALMDAYLLGKPEAQAWLRSGAAATIPGGEAEWQHK
jgi:predicted dienelactone hydrolase